MFKLDLGLFTNNFTVYNPKYNIEGDFYPNRNAREKL